MGKLVSVVVPVYNVEKYLKYCIDSIINQTYTYLEVVLVNDGSTDLSGNICDQMAETDSRIKVIHKQNGGLSSARNSGMQYISGDYVIFVDSDDWLENTMIEKLYKAAIENQAEIVSCGFYQAKNEYDLPNNGNVQYDGKVEVYSSIEAMKKIALRQGINVSAWGKIFKREILQNIKFPEGEIHEDVAVIYHLVEKCTRFSSMEIPLYFYRYNPDGISKQEYTNKYDVVLKHDLENEKLIGDKYPELREAMRYAVAGSCFDMMLKIAKTQNGYETFRVMYNTYRENLLQRLNIFIKYKGKNIKTIVWLVVLLARENWIFNKIAKSDHKG